MRLFLLLLWILAQTAPKDDIFVLVNGDRVTGKTVTKGKTALVVQTAFGRLTIPRAKIERIFWADGHEEVLNAPPTPPPAPEPSLHLALTFTGHAFWQAWSRPEAEKELDTTLRLEVRLDSEVIAAYVDNHLDPGDLPGALVNSFSFTAGEVVVTAADGVAAQPPETRQGKSILKIDLPSSRAGKKHLVLAYQSNDGTSGNPSWHDLARGEIDIDIEKGPPAEVTIQQTRGRMEYSGLLHKKMRNVETFRIELRGGEPVKPPEPSPRSGLTRESPGLLLGMWSPLRLEAFSPAWYSRSPSPRAQAFGHGCPSSSPGASRALAYSSSGLRTTSSPQTKHSSSSASRA